MVGATHSGGDNKSLDRTRRSGSCFSFKSRTVQCLSQLLPSCRSTQPLGRNLMKLTKISYARLNARQKENYNFQKISAVLAEYGYVTFRFSDDWSGADFIAVHLSGDVLRVQLKG